MTDEQVEEEVRRTFTHQRVLLPPEMTDGNEIGVRILNIYDARYAIVGEKYTYGQKLWADGQAFMCDGNEASPIELMVSFSFEPVVHDFWEVDAAWYLNAECEPEYQSEPHIGCDKCMIYIRQGGES